MTPHKIIAATTVPHNRNVVAGDIRNYFDYATLGVEVVEVGLKEISFGEFLVESNVLSRYQLFRALQLQDQQPGVRVGEAAAALGYIAVSQVERLYKKFNSVDAVTVE